MVNTVFLREFSQLLLKHGASLEEIKPHKIRYYLEKRDPEFKEKMNWEVQNG